MRIGVVAPAGRFARETADLASALVHRLRPDIDLFFHPQCFQTHNHFAGTDASRMAAFVEVANDPGFDAVWFARGGYGSNRIAHEAVARLNPGARDKAYVGYSDMGYMLAALYKARFPHVAHGPMPTDIRRPGGTAAVARALEWIVHRSRDSLEPHVQAGQKRAAFNITVFGTMLGTQMEPDLAGHVLMLEDVGEFAYRVDRAMSQIVGQPHLRRLAGIRLGRVSDSPPNDPDFGETPEQIVRFWCGRAGIPYLGPADIGHDAANKVVPFGAD